MPILGRRVAASTGKGVPVNAAGALRLAGHTAWATPGPCQKIDGPSGANATLAALILQVHLASRNQKPDDWFNFVVRASGRERWTVCWRSGGGARGGTVDEVLEHYSEDRQH